MVKTFADAATAELFGNQNSKAVRKAFPQELWNVMKRKLSMVAAATKPEDLNTPGNRIKHLSATRPGFYSMRVNDRFRVTFRFEGGHAYDVKIDDDKEKFE